MEAFLASDLAKFLERVTDRLEAGSRVYGGASTRLPTGRLVDEIQQELEDVAGWSVLLWSKLERLRAKVEADSAASGFQDLEDGS